MRNFTKVVNPLILSLIFLGCMSVASWSYAQTISNVIYQEPHVFPEPGAVSGSPITYPSGLSANNVIVGSASYPSTQAVQAFVRIPASSSPQNVPAYEFFSLPASAPGYTSGTSTGCGKINEYGFFVCGAAPFNSYGQFGPGTNYVFSLGSGQYQEIQLSGSSMFSLSGINSAGVMVGAVGPYGFIRQTNGSYVDFAVPNATQTSAVSINSSGWVVGTYYLSNNSINSHAFLMVNGNAFNIDPPGQNSENIMYATDINDNGVVVVGLEIVGPHPTPPNQSISFLVNYGMVNPVYNQVQFSSVPNNYGYYCLNVNALNNNNYIAGIYTDAAGGNVYPFLAAPQGGGIASSIKFKSILKFPSDILKETELQKKDSNFDMSYNNRFIGKVAFKYHQPGSMASRPGSKLQINSKPSERLRINRTIK